MSYPYGQFTGENYSTPPTPLDGFPQWETVEHEQQLQQQQQQQQQSQQHSQQHSQEHTPTQPTPTFQLIHLEDPPVNPDQSPEIGLHDDAPVHLHHVPNLRPSEGRLDTLRKDTFGSLKYIDPLGSSGSASGAPKSGAGATSSSTTTMAVRSARSTRQHQQTLHPYQRPQSAMGRSSTATVAGPSRSMPMRDGPVPLRFVHHNLNPSVPTSSSVPSAMPSPASAPGRMGGFGSVGSSPVTQLHSTLFNTSPRIPDNPPSSVAPPPRKKWLIRTDVNYDPDTHILTAVLELPGLKRKDVRVTLSTCHYNRVRQLTVSGTSYPTFPVPPPAVMSLGGADHTVRERRFGDFTRTFPVPHDLKREDIDAKLQDGILTIKIPCGPPAEFRDPQEVTVN